MSIFPDLTDNITSALVQDQLPEFVKNNYTIFTAFLESYYEYLEQSGKLTNTAKNIPNFLDIDYVVENNLTDFITLFQNTYLNNIPNNILADKAKLLKHIKTYYSSKGTAKSFSFLFRAMFNEPVEIFNTGQHILRASDGKWYQPIVIRILPLSFSTIDIDSNDLGIFDLGLDILGTSSPLAPPTPLDWVSTQIFGQTSYASAIVESAQITNVPGLNYYELTLSNITKEFLPSERIYANTATGQIFGTVLGTITGIDIVNPGSSYNVGDPVLITGGGGANATGVVGSVTAGNLIDLGIAKSGSGYQLFPNWVISVTGSGVTGIDATIFSIDTSGTLAPNTFSIINNLIAPSLNISLNSTFSNFTVPNITANSRICDAVQTVTYNSCGPINLIHVVSGGHGFTSQPNITVTQAQTIGATNTKLIDYGAIGTFRILNAGQNYAVNDDIVVTGQYSHGIGGAGRVTSVNGGGSIISTIVDLPSISGYANVTSGSATVTGFGTLFTSQLLANNNATTPGSGTTININNETKKVMTIASDTSLTVNSNFGATKTGNPIRLVGYMLGGYGYQPSDFPAGVNTTVRSLTGDGTAVVVPDGVLGEDASLIPVGSVFGQIQNITMTNFGDHYTSIPSIDLSQSGDGTAIGMAQFISGQFNYPGYFLNEDGQLSSRRYLEDPNTYNNYSYQIKSKALVNAYYSLVYQMLNPVGANMLGITRIPVSTGHRDVGSSTSVFITTSNIIIDLNFILNLSVLS